MTKLSAVAVVAILLLATAGSVSLLGCSLLRWQPEADAARNGTTGGSGTEAKTLSTDWVQTTKADFATGVTEKLDITSAGDGELGLAMSAGRYASTGVYTSTVKESSFPFNAVGIQWRARVPGKTEVVGEIRTSADGASYSDWKRVDTGSDAEDRAENGAQIAELVLTPFHRWMQYRVTLRTRDANVSPVVEEVEVTFIDSTRGPDLLMAKAAVIQSKVAGQPAVIPRSAWGADESLRFKNGEEIWPPERKAVEKIIIHHTATQNDDPNPPATIRAIYQYHAVRLGWGDIGYQYLIDAQGNIYEGRYGGDDVAAGHAKQYNFGSLGISVLGNYNVAGVSGQAKDALVKLVTRAVLHYGIDPNGSSYFVDKEFPNISGHSDALPTTCPGHYLENELPDIRAKAASQIPRYGLKWGGSDTPSAFAPGQTVPVSVTLSNRGRTIWTARGNNNFRLGYHWYRPDGTQVVQRQADDKRTALPRDLSFGQVVSLNALVTAPEIPGTYTLRWDLVQEGVTWFADRGVDSPEVTVRVDQSAPAPSPTPSTPGTARSTWYFAEGSTTRGYQTLFQLMNPDSQPANVTITLMTEAGTTDKRSFTAKPTSRLTINASDLLPNINMSAKIESDRMIYAERTMVFGHDGHSSTGAAQPAATWYFAEGSTGWGFSTWLLLMNPNDVEAKVSVTFFRENGQPVSKDFRLKPTSRLNVFVNREVPNANVGVKVHADQPIVAERSVYIDGGKGGHGSIGVTETSTRWLFAEGYTGQGFHDWLLLMNPNNAEAKVTVSFFDGSGAATVRSYTLPPSSRRNVDVNQIVPNAAISTRVDSSLPIVAERSMYFGGGKSAHNTVGVAKGARTWYLPEGYTGSGVNEWILIFNPGSSAADVTLTFMRRDGTTSSTTLTVAPLSRYTLYVNSVISNADLATKIVSTQPIVVERAMYFDQGQAGTVSLGIPEG